MAETLERSKLHVEGDDDLHTVVHLLIRNGVDYDTKPWPKQFPYIEEKKGIDKLLAGMETAIRLNTNRTIGFLLDADAPLQERWAGVRERLLAAKVADVPEQPVQDGFVGSSPAYKSRVGVWLMPDNVQDGKLEDFLRSLISEGNSLIGHAEASTDKAVDLGAGFSPAHRIKAVIHAWLAWQETPGLPYGTAMRAKYFLHDTDTATRFIRWFRLLYQLE